MKRISRRDLLLSGSKVALGVGLLPWLSVGCGSSNPINNALTGPDALSQLASVLQGGLLRTQTDEFLSLAAPWNLRYLDRLPSAIARCETIQDVQNCLAWVQTYSVPFVARAGGHSYAGYSTTPGLMIDLSSLTSLDFDQTNGQAVVGGGAHNSTLYAALPPFSVAVTHGRCPSVGVGGLTLGGGIGFNMRLHGLLIDQLIETTLVTAAGDVLRCNEQENSDILWACRGGGGGNFGINTSFTFQTYPVTTVTVFDIVWTTDLDSLLPFALNYLSTTPNEFGCKLSVVQDGLMLRMDLLGQLVGTETEVINLLAPLFGLAAPTQQVIQTMEYWDGQGFLSEAGLPEYVHERSRYIFSDMPPEGAATILDFLRRWPGTLAETNWKMFLMGGAVSAVASDATAYVHRQAKMISSIELEWTADDSAATVAINEAWLDEFHSAMEPFTSDQAYQNFIDEDETDFLRAYYGANLERLVQVKRQVDPNNVFQYPQSIPLELPGV
jgi:FAD/FMN-containing dehydrogenase